MTSGLLSGARPARWGQRAKAIRKQHDRLVSELAGESLALVDAFGIPDEVLAAPIAMRAMKDREAAQGT